jgi:DNA repair protein RecO
MLVKTKGIVIKRIPYTDHSAVVHIYTELSGLAAFLVQGLGKAKSKNAYYQSGTAVELVYTVKQSPGLLRIKEISALKTSIVPDAMDIQQVKFFYTELISLCVHEHFPDAIFFQLVLNEFDKLNSANKSQLKYLPIQFVLNVCRGLGYELDWQQFYTPSWIITALDELENQQAINLNQEQRRLVLNEVLNQLKYYAFPDKKLKSLEIFEGF